MARIAGIFPTLANSLWLFLAMESRWYMVKDSRQTLPVG
jgi:hypothetical protein